MPTESELRKYIQDLADFYDDQGDMTTSVFHGTTEKATIVNSRSWLQDPIGWTTIEDFVTNVIFFAGLYHVYARAVSREADENKTRSCILYRFDPDTGEPSTYGTTWGIPDGDLQLNRDGFFPDFDDHASPYLVPEAVQPVADMMNEIVGELVFYDEYTACGKCGQIIRTSPDCYEWQPDFVDTEDGIVHVDCVTVDDALEAYSRKRAGLPPAILSRAISEGRVFEIDHTWENGMHPGMNDDPEKISDFLLHHGITQWWWDVMPSQFYVEFKLVLTVDDTIALSELYHPETGEDISDRDASEKVEIILASLDVYQGYDTAAEMSKALKGIHSDHITVTKRTL